MAALSHPQLTAGTLLFLNGGTSGPPAACENTRSVVSIVWSCLGTIFLCTWVAIHPNIAVPYRRGLSRALHRVKLLIVALVVPEFIVMWAIRQYYAASEITSRYNLKGRHGWTPSHSFFMVMGGFHLYDGNKPLHPLSPDHLDDLVQKGIVDFPDITEDEIKDKGNSDALSKVLVILQTTWFIVQCIARAIQHLPITELEITTIAFATLNVVTYLFWWNKPLNVHHPFRVVMKRQHRESNDVDVDHPIREYGRHGNSETGIPLVDRNVGQGDDGPTTIDRNNQSVVKRSWNWLNKVMNYLGGLQDDEVTLSKVTKVPTFYSHRGLGLEGQSTSFFVGLFLAVVFGVIHCIAWSFAFPTPIERIIWRASSIALIAMPMMLLVGATLLLEDNYVLVFLRVLIFGLAQIVYLFSRMTLLVLAFISLRSLPHGALESVWWTTFIPHF